MEITVQELAALDPKGYMLLDMRGSEAREYGSIPGSVGVSPEELSRYNGDRGKKVIIYCARGQVSLDAAIALRERSYDAYSLSGGYLAWLQDEMEKQEAAALCRQVEESIRKRFHSKIWCCFTRAIREYELVKEGDRIAVCISGGKDSMLMAKLFQELKLHNKFPFEVEFLVMDPGYSPENRRVIEENARKLNIPIHIFESNIFESVYHVEKSPCYLCARMRRGYLYRYAQELGCNKIALGHHLSDVLETTLLGLFYGAQLQTMPPKLRSKNFPGMELIRPLYCVHEDAIIAWKNYNHLQFLQCACRFTEEREAAGDGVGRSKRQEIKFLLRELKKTNPNIEKSIFQGINGLQLDTFPGFKHRGVFHSFPELYNHPDWFAGETKSEEISEEL